MNLLRWTRWNGHKNYLYVEPANNVIMEVNGMAYTIIVNTKIVAFGDTDSQRAAIDVCESWWMRQCEKCEVVT